MRTTQQPNQPNNSINPIHSTTILSFLGCLFALFFAPCVLVAADFAGSLKSVSITDSAGTNQPPVAVIDYTLNGDTVNFDASASTDSDGTIVEYKWDFGDETTGSGATVSHLFGLGSFSVTLTTLDDAGGIALFNQLINIEQPTACIGGGPSSTECNPTITPSKIVTLNIDRTTVFRWLPQKNGKVKRVKIYFGSPVDGDWSAFDNLQVIVYRGKTIMATAPISPISNSWVWSSQLIAQNGQDLTFDTSTDLYFGLTVKVPTGASPAPGYSLGSFEVNQNPSYYYKNLYMPYGESWGMVTSRQVAAILEYIAQ